LPGNRFARTVRSHQGRLIRGQVRGLPTVRSRSTTGARGFRAKGDNLPAQGSSPAGRQISQRRERVTTAITVRLPQIAPLLHPAGPSAVAQRRRAVPPAVEVRAQVAAADHHAPAVAAVAAGDLTVVEPLAAAEAARTAVVVEPLAAVVGVVEADRTVAAVVVTTRAKPRFLCHQRPCAGC
jgi:hypothetical protein